MSFIKRKKKIDNNEPKNDSISYKYTICEKCGNNECSNVGERNIHHGYNIKSCKSYRDFNKKRNKSHPYENYDYDNDEMMYPFGYVPNI